MWVPTRERPVWGNCSRASLFFDVAHLGLERIAPRLAPGRWRRKNSRTSETSGSPSPRWCTRTLGDSARDASRQWRLGVLGRAVHFEATCPREGSCRAMIADAISLARITAQFIDRSRLLDAADGVRAEPIGASTGQSCIQRPIQRRACQIHLPILRQLAAYPGF